MVARDFERALQSLAGGRQRIRMPKAQGLYRRIPGTFFHATPEFFIQTGGGTDFSCPGGNFRLRTREICVIPGGVPHGEVPVDLQTPYEILVCMHARDGFLLHRARADKRRKIYPVETDHLISPRGRMAFRYLEDLANPTAERHRRSYEQALVEAFLIAILGELHQPSAAAASRSSLVAGAERIARALLSDPGLSVAGLAASLGCSADYLSRRFRVEREMTLSQWIVRERVAMARDLLADPQRRVADVGWACGFNATSYFIRVFRQHTGMTPKAWQAETPPA